MGVIRILRNEGGLDRHYSSVEQMTPYDQIEVETLTDLETAADGSQIAEFVTRMETRATVLAASSDEKGVELNTIHGAKGREWPTVILYGANGDQLPHFRTLAEAATEEAFEEAIEDERRLMYVAVTRTKRRLVVVATTEDHSSPFLREAGLVDGPAPMPTMPSVQAAVRAAGQSPGRPAGADRRTVVAKYKRRCGGVQGLDRARSADRQGRCRMGARGVRFGLSPTVCR